MRMCVNLRLLPVYVRACMRARVLWESLRM